MSIPRNKRTVLQRIDRLERLYNKLVCCGSPTPTPGGATLVGYIQLVVGVSGELVIFQPYSTTAVAYPAAATTVYTLAAMDDYNITVHLNGQGYLVEGVDYSRSGTGLGSNLNRLGGFQYEDKEVYTIFLYAP